MSRTEAWAELSTPTGPKGSGRARYAAAMSLYNLGEINAAELEAYREAAASDRRDPAEALADRGLPLPRPSNRPSDKSQ